MLKELPSHVAKMVSIGDWILYRNQYDQTFNAKVVRKHLSADGRIFIMVKREGRPHDECLALSDFENGTYTLLS